MCLIERLTTPVMLDDKLTLALFDLVAAFQRGELSFVQMEKKAKQLRAQMKKKPKKRDLAKSP